MDKKLTVMRKILIMILLSPMILAFLLFDIIKLPVVIVLYLPVLMIMSLADYIATGHTSAFKYSWDFIKEFVFCTSLIFETYFK